jgi:hypothetical protein
VYGGRIVGTSSSRVIATRRLAYAFKDDPTRRAFTVRLHEPFIVEPGSVDFDVSGWTSGCLMSFDGLNEKEWVTYGADEVQAVELAIQHMEDHLRRLSKKYDLYFDDGEPYFED